MPNPVRQNNNEIGAILFMCVSEGQMQAYIAHMYLNICVWYIYIYTYINIFYNNPLSSTHTCIYNMHIFIYYVKCFLDITAGGAAAADETVKGIVDQIGRCEITSQGRMKICGDSLRFTEIH